MKSLIVKAEILLGIHLCELLLSSICSCSVVYLKVLIVTDAKGSIREIILPKGLDLDRPKRTRTSFTAEQLYRLEMEFQRCQYVVGRERTELARQLNLSETQVCMQPTLQTIFKILKLFVHTTKCFGLFFLKQQKCAN